MSDTQLKKTRIIPKQDAVFWMDAQGRWCNQHGRFEHKRIIDYFNSCIEKDAQGYYVGHTIDGVYEKVYFRYEDTPVFVVSADVSDKIILILNTGARLPLQVNRLFVRKDSLYFHFNSEIAKFKENVLLKLADRLDEKQGQYRFFHDDQWHSIKCENS
ncbi:MAG: MFS transporter permease [Desulfobacteraceae bacterium]|nr:MFS transporter permease [Desulfobacteraceae bacterium]